MGRRYRTIETVIDESGVRRYKNPVYPDVEPSSDDLYVITTGEDRYDTLANQFYGDPSLWWIIAVANPTLRRDGLVVEKGVQLRIPVNKEAVISAYETLNKTR